jgi:hypothetical protein
MATNEIKMGINLRQNKNVKNAGYGKYYPEVDTQETLTLKGFAKHMSDHGSIYTLDMIEGVLKKITQCLPELISQGVPIRLDPLGTFLPTCSVDKPLNDIPDMEGADPNEVVKGVHIRFLPYGVEDENITSRRFKREYCSLEFRNIIDTREVTVEGKKKKVTTLTPIETAIADWKADHGQSSSTGSDTGNSGSGSENSGNSGNYGNSGNSGNSGSSEQNQATTFALTISTSGSGSASVTHDGNAVTSGSNLSEDDEVEISITPAEGKVPTATVNGSSIELTEDGGVYTGNFAMPAQASTLVINTGTAEGGDSGDGIDKD